MLIYDTVISISISIKIKGTYGITCQAFVSSKDLEFVTKTQLL